MTPILATAVLGIAGMSAVIVFDLLTFAAAFVTLAWKIRIPETSGREWKRESLLTSAGQGIVYLRTERGIFGLILFLAAINLVASIYDAAFPAMMLSRKGGNETVMGMVNAVIGIATLVGSILASVLPKPKSRVRVICNSLLFAMSFENFMLALGRTPLIWCIGGFLGWIAIPLMNTNLDVILRTRIPLEMQGRVYSVRNSFQFFTIPIGYFLGGFLVDRVFEPMMAAQKEGSFLIRLFWRRKRIRSGGSLFRDCICGNRSLPLVPERSPYLGIGKRVYIRREDYGGEMMTNEEILRIAMEQSAVDANCLAEDFVKTENKIVYSKRAAGRTAVSGIAACMSSCFLRDQYCGVRR